MPYKRQVKYDYNEKVAHGAVRRSKARERQIAVCALVLSIAIGAIFTLRHILPTSAATSDLRATSSIVLELPEISSTSKISAVKLPNDRIPFEPRTYNSAKASNWSTVTVAPGDNLSLIFGRYGFSKKDLHQILALGPEAKNLRSIKPGQQIKVRSDGHGRVIEIVQELDYLRSLHVVSELDNYSMAIVEIEPEIRHASAQAEIKHSLFLDGQAAGLSDKTIMELADIFGWDIDFVLDVRVGDRFSVVFEELFKDDEKVKNGKILAAEFVNRGEKLRAVYYSKADGTGDYYSDTGRAMRKAFLRAPVNFTRISSRFNLRRRHPVLNTIRAHKGVDYAAPHGTPIRATADGKIIFAGNKGGYGRTVVIQHGESYSTLFAHMSRISRGVKNGSRIKQGQTIGYVGKTGLATGPHLHYEFRINGVHRNPLKVRLPEALPLEKKYIADFLSRAEPLLTQLNGLSDVAKSDNLVADADPQINQASSTPTRSKTQ